MKKTIFILCLVCAVTTCMLVIGCNESKDKSTGTVTAISKDSLIRRGEQLVVTMGCDDCHSPKKMGAHGPEIDMDKRLSGHPAQMPLGKIDPESLKSWVLFNMMNTAAVGPWGASFSSNLTSSASGIGEWTEERFFKAIREGKSKGTDGNRMLLPPMPWQGISKASDDDLKAIFAFLKSTKPIDNVVPQPIVPDQLAKLTK